MAIRKSVFGSIDERQNFAKLMRTWGGTHNVYHNLPFLNVIAARDDLRDERGQLFRVTEAEYDLLKKASIDYTVCTKQDAPVVGIEFDGLDDGVNVGAAYFPREGRPVRQGRKYMLDLKLKVAHGAGFPFFVLGSQQFSGLADSVRLTIADGLIGEVLANQERERRFREFSPDQCGMSQEDFDVLSDSDRTSVIENWALEVEVMCDYEHNPIHRQVAQLSREVGATGESISFPRPAGIDMERFTVVQAAVRTRDGASAEAVLQLPEFRTPSCGITIGLAIEVAKLLALAKVQAIKRRSAR